MIRRMKKSTYKNLRNQERDTEALKNGMKNVADEENRKHKELQPRQWSLQLQSSVLQYFHGLLTSQKNEDSS
ncbi:unnamed protein product [Dovyalis caffra]|uniref:Uncharacterized protein n=1 Tax=Dovyalis caffra TaxID=77055 RepID=A0AAV1S1H3_9ROSI|nr:unnamed protein product [Dovyalis caffra]